MSNNNYRFALLDNFTIFQIKYFTEYLQSLDEGSFHNQFSDIPFMNLPKMIELGLLFQQIKEKENEQEEKKEEKEEKDKYEKEQILNKNLIDNFDEREFDCFMGCCGSFNLNFKYKSKINPKPDFTYHQINSKKTSSDGATIEKNETTVEGKGCICNKCLIF